MSLWDKFLGFMSLNGDDEYEEDDDFYDDEEEEPKKSFLNRGKEKEEDDTGKTFKGKPEKSTSKVTPIRQIKRQGSSMEVCVIKPATVEDAREITETLLSSRTVVLNLEGLDVDIAQRIIDFTSGSCFAINGNLQKISNYIFIISPSNVDISGDFQDILNGAFDVSTLQGDF